MSIAIALITYRLLEIGLLIIGIVLMIWSLIYTPVIIVSLYSLRHARLAVRKYSQLIMLTMLRRTIYLSWAATIVVVLQRRGDLVVWCNSVSLVSTIAYIWYACHLVKNSRRSSPPSSRVTKHPAQATIVTSVNHTPDTHRRTSRKDDPS